MTGVQLEGATALHLSANFSQVEIRQAEGDEITIEHSVVVEGKRRPELAELSVSRDGETIRVREVSPTQDDLKSQWKNGNDRDCCKSDIRMIVRVPAGVAVSVETVYGGVDVEGLPGLREVDATYGGVTVVVPPGQPLSDLKLYSNYGTVDLSLPAGTGADLELETEYGELLTDLDITIDGDASKRRDFFERVVGRVGGGGALVQMRAPYGKVYLRGGS
jgi:hypothetical protein